MHQLHCVLDLAMLETTLLTPQDLTLLHGADQHKASDSPYLIHRIGATGLAQHCTQPH